MPRPDRRRQSEVQRGVQVVDREVTELPVADDRQHAEAERPRSGRESSSPSVRFTAFELEMITRIARTIHPIDVRFQPGSENLVNDRLVDV